MTRLSDAEQADIVQLLSSPKPALRVAAARRLSARRHPQIHRVLEQARRDPDALVRRAATVALLRLGDPALRERLLAALQNPNPEIAAGAVVLLSEARCKEAVAPLCAMLQRAEVGPMAADALGLLGDLRAAPPLLRAVASPHTATRNQATRALGKLCRDSKDVTLAMLAAPALERALLDQDRSVRMNAALALWHLDDPLRDRAAMAAFQALSQATQPVVLSGEASLAV